jgi:hypothetical protein
MNKRICYIPNITEGSTNEVLASESLDLRCFSSLFEVAAEHCSSSFAISYEQHQGCNKIEKLFLF